MSSTSPKIAGIGRLRIGVENDYSDTSSDMHYVKAQAVDLSGLEQAGLEDLQIRRADFQSARILGPRIGSIQTTHFLTGWNSSVPVAAPVFDDELGAGSGGTTTGWHMLMSAIGSALGNCESDGYTTTVDTGASTTDQIKGTDLMDFKAGQPLAWSVAAGGYQVGWATGVTDATPDTLDLLQTASDTPNTASLYGAFYAWQTTGSVYHDIQHDESNTISSYTLEYLGHDSDDAIEAVGCLPTALTMSFVVGELPTISITWGVGQWTEASSGGLGGAAAQDSYSHPLPQPVMDGWITKGTSAASTMRISSLEVDLQIERPMILDASMPQGCGGYGPITRRPKMSFSVYRDYSEEVVAWEDQEADSYVFTFGTQPGKLISICCPAGRITELPQRGETDGAVTSEVTIEANEYTSDSGALPSDGTTAIDSDFRIGFI